LLKSERFVGDYLNGMARRLPSSLHVFAGILLLLFAFSHFAFLRISGFEGGLPNAVFPFFTNNDLYFAAGFLEGLTAVACFRFCGRDFTNIIVLTFVTIMLLYRWAFNFTGGSHCGCLGLLGKLLHVSKREETIIPNLALLYLISTTIPWFYSALRAVRQRALLKLWISLTAALSLQPTHASGEGSTTIEVYGEYHAAAQNPQSGKTYHDSRRVDASFVVIVIMGGNAWKVCATNLNTGQVGQIWCDGIETYTSETVEKGGTSPSTIVTVSPSQFYLGSYSGDYLDMSLPWLTYCLSPDMIAPDTNGIIALPIPWMNPRVSLGAYLYKWIISPSEGQFIESLSTVRDNALDLSDDQALLRSDFVYPSSIGGYNRERTTLNFLRTIPNGWVETKFKCTQWYHTNHILIPAESEIQHYMFPGAASRPPFPHPLFYGKLKAINVILLKAQGHNWLPTSASQESHVFDFRYRQANKTRIYRYAEYTLHPGESWKSADDPTLLSQAARYLKHGPRFDAFFYPNKRNNLVWLLFGFVILIPVMAVLWNKHKKTKMR